MRSWPSVNCRQITGLWGKQMIKGVVAKEDIDNVLFDVKEWRRKLNRADEEDMPMIAGDALYDIFEQLTKLVEEVEMKELSLLVQSK